MKIESLDSQRIDRPASDRAVSAAASDRAASDRAVFENGKFAESAAVAEAVAVAARFDFVAARAAATRWFAANGRVFPWRSDATPYRVWISETMLQQTTTQTVVGYFDRFLRRFPDVEALARADEATVLTYWEGLGYYRRAKALRAAAIEIVERFGGAFPDRFDDALSLPGVGRYTAGAILSFGFDRRAPILEANTTRLHARLLALPTETTTAAAQKILWNFAESWLPEESNDRKTNLYRDLNGALTDLGRLVCSPTDPKCDGCPLAEFCESRRRELQNVVPFLKRKSEKIARTDVAFWIERGELFDVPDASANDVLLIRRPENVLWAGLWDVPRFEATRPEFLDATDFSADSALCDRLRLFLEEEVGAAPFDYRPGRVVKTLKHSVTRFRITLRFCRLASAAPAEKTLFDALEVVSPNNVKRHLLSTPDEFSSDDFSEKFSETPFESPSEILPENLPEILPKKSGERTTSLSDAARVAAEIRWVSPDALDGYPLSSTGRKLAKWLAEKRR